MYNVEMTDTFGGEANYCWATRDQIEANSLKQAITRFKKKHGVNVKHKLKYDSGDFRRVDLVDACVCIFASWGE